MFGRRDGSLRPFDFVQIYILMARFRRISLIMITQNRELGSKYCKVGTTRL